jgi:predicted dithiol-disulfide oxidoreductase (DUF899 family)
MTQTDWLQLKSVALWDGVDLPVRLWPEGASEDYVAARRALGEAEMALRERVEEVARMRRELPPGAVLHDYEFAEGPRDLTQDEPVRTTTLRELFGEHDALVVYHLMFHPDDEASCAMCALWVDGLHGVSHHITRRAGLAVVAKAPLPKLRRWAHRRGWDGLRIVSSHDSSSTPTWRSRRRTAPRCPRSAHSSATARRSAISRPGPPTSPTAPSAAST